MFKLEVSRMFSILISSLIAFIWLPQPQAVSGGSVTSLCLTEQWRLLNITDKAKKREEDMIIGTITAVCGGYEQYVTCFTNNLPNSHEVGDRFSRLIFQPESMTQAYRGLCTKDLKVLRRIKSCLVETDERTDCYKRYEKSVRKVVELEDHGTFTTRDLERLACNVSVGRYKCEIESYRVCNRKAGEIMKNFIYASLSDKCRTRMGLTSRYLRKRLVGGENGGNEFQQGGENSASIRSFGVVNKFMKTFLGLLLDTVAFSVRQFQ